MGRWARSGNGVRESERKGVVWGGRGVQHLSLSSIRNMSGNAYIFECYSTCLDREHAHAQLEVFVCGIRIARRPIICCDLQRHRESEWTGGKLKFRSEKRQLVARLSLTYFGLHYRHRLSRSLSTSVYSSLTQTHILTHLIAFCFAAFFEVVCLVAIEKRETIRSFVCGTKKKNKKDEHMVKILPNKDFLSFVSLTVSGQWRRITLVVKKIHRERARQFVWYSSGEKYE